MDWLLTLLVVDEVPEDAAVRVGTIGACPEEEVNGVGLVVVTDQVLDSSPSPAEVLPHPPWEAPSAEVSMAKSAEVASTAE